MPIPSSEPGKFKPAGSVGVQVDIGIGSNVFDAIAGAGRAFDKLKEESQKSVDTTNSYKTGDLRDQLGKLIQEDITNNGIQNDPDKWSESIESTISAWEERYSDATKGSSKEAAEAFMFAREKAVRDARTNFGGKAIAQLNENEKTQAVSRSNTLIENGDLNGSIQTIAQSDKFSEAEKIQHVDRIHRAYVGLEIEAVETSAKIAKNSEEMDVIIEETKERQDIPLKKKDQLMQKLVDRKGSLFKVAERISMEQYELDSIDTINESDVNELQESVNSDKTLGDTARIRTNQMLEKRKISIRNSDVSDLNKSLRVASKDLKMILDGSIQSPLQISDSIPPEIKNGLINVIKSKGGSRGTDSKEYLNLIDKIEGGVGLDAMSDIALKKDITEFVMDENNSADAVISVLHESLGLLSVETEDNDLESFLGLEDTPEGPRMKWKDGEIDLNEAQVKAIRDTAFTTRNLINFVNAEQSWKNSTISQKDMASLYLYMHDIEVINGFAQFDVSTPEGLEAYQKHYNETIGARMDRAILREAKSKVRKQIQGFNN